LKLSRIDIKGFKSIRDASLSLRNINILIGSNGAGKSNFITVFTLMQKMIEKELQIYVSECGVSALLYKGRKVTSRMTMEFYFGANSYGFVLVPTDDGRLTFASEFASYNGTHCQISGPKGYYESEYEKGCGNGIDAYVRPVLSMKDWKVYHFHDTSRFSGMKQEHNLADNLQLQQDASNLAPFLYMLEQMQPKSYEKIINVIQLAAPYFKDFVLVPQINNEKIAFRWRQTDCDDVFGASQLSDGTLRFICLATLFCQPSEYQPSVIILDEPELGLHPYAIELLAEMIRSVSTRKQVIISTQSADLISEFEPEDIVVTEMGSEGTTFRRLDSNALNEWLKEDYSLGELWKKNVLGGRP